MNVNDSFKHLLRIAMKTNTISKEIITTYKMFLMFSVLTYDYNDSSR